MYLNVFLRYIYRDLSYCDLSHGKTKKIVYRDLSTAKILKITTGTTEKYLIIYSLSE